MGSECRFGYRPPGFPRSYPTNICLGGFILPSTRNGCALAFLNITSYISIFMGNGCINCDRNDRGATRFSVASGLIRNRGRVITIIRG